MPYNNVFRPKTDTLLGRAIILHDEITGVVWYSAKTQEFLPSRIFHHSDENIVFS